MSVGAIRRLKQELHQHISVGLGFKLERLQKETDSARPSGMGAIDPTMMDSVFASYNGNPSTFSLLPITATNTLYKK